MAVRSERTISIAFSGDFDAAHDFVASPNSGSPGTVINYQMLSGANSLVPLLFPAGTIKAITIVPPQNNTTLMTLKGAGGDTGIPISKTEPTSIALFDTSAVIISTTVTTGLPIVQLIFT